MTRRDLDHDPQGRTSEAGFTLVEVIVASALMVAIVTPALMFLNTTQRSEVIVQQGNQQLQESRLAMESMGRSLRQGGFLDGTSSADSAIFISAADNDLTFYSDLDSDGVTEKVRFYLSGTTLRRDVIRADCSTDPCTFPVGSTVETTTLLPYVRNAAPSICGSAYASNTPVPVFAYQYVDRGTGALYAVPTPTSDIADLVDISYVTINTLVDITPNKTPTCAVLKSNVNLRNWRG